MKIHSKKKENLLLHIINRLEDASDTRHDLIAPDQFLQVAVIKHPKGKSFKKHQHLSCEKIVNATQESWVIIQGSIKIFLYDIDGEFLLEEILNAGDFLVTLYGGHTYETLEEDTLVYEFKTGPYLGIEKDKKMI